MTRVVMRPGGIDALLGTSGIRRALENIGGKVQDEAVRITSIEAVDTGLMTASWRLRPRLERKGWVVRVINTARSEPPERASYPYFQEFGWRTRNGRHIPGKHILTRSIDAARQ
jgi:hypothetical protein